MWGVDDIKKVNLPDDNIGSVLVTEHDLSVLLFQVLQCSNHLWPRSGIFQPGQGFDLQSSFHFERVVRGGPVKFKGTYIGLITREFFEGSGVAC